MDRVEVRFSAGLWEHSGEGGWHFVTVPPEAGEEIRLHAGEPRGFGSVRVSVTVGSSHWSTSVFPDAASGSFVLPVKKAVRAAEGVAAGDRIAVVLQLVDG